LEDWRKDGSSYGEMNYIPGDWKIGERRSLLMMRMIIFLEIGRLEKGWILPQDEQRTTPGDLETGVRFDMFMHWTTPGDLETGVR